MSRRILLADLGKGTLALAVLGIACARSGSPATNGGPSTTSGPTPSTGQPAGSAPTSATWHRVNLGFVSAYLIARSGEVAIIDTGVAGSVADIEAGITAAGFGWDAVGTVILTHHHADHQGSLPDVMTEAPAATAYAGAEDIAAISSPRPVTAVGDGDQIFGLTIVATPGHTPGHVAVLDPELGLLLAGDAIRGEAGGVVGPNPRFTEDMTVANESVVKLGKLTFEIVAFGHGDPLEGAASTKVAELAARL